jgi:hypothetical protein
MCPHCKRPDSKIVKRDYLDGRPSDWMCQACGRQVKGYQPGGDIVLYDRMLVAINECHQTDEVKDIRDRALALEHCARIAKNLDAERKAAEIRIRAERRTGELLKELEKGKGGRPPENSLHDANSLFSKAKEDAGISDNQAARWQQLADIPKEEFEKAILDPEERPSTSGLVAKTKPPSFLKPIIDLPPVLKLDDNPRYCHASCCNGETEVRGPWGIHDAQSLCDAKSLPRGYFGKDHKAVLDLCVESYWNHAIAELGGKLTDGAFVGKRRPYNGIGQKISSWKVKK